MERGRELSAMTETIIGCLIRVHRALGPGFREKVYQRALLVEFRRVGLEVEREVVIPISYENRRVGSHRLDLVVEGTIVIELKAVREITKVHYAQLRSYMRASGIPIGLLTNFSLERTDVRRLDAKPSPPPPNPPPLSKKAGETLATRINTRQ